VLLFKNKYEKFIFWLFFSSLLLFSRPIYEVPLTLVHESGHVLGGLLAGGDVRGIFFNWSSPEPAYTDMTISANRISYFIAFFSGGAFAFSVFYIHYLRVRQGIHSSDKKKIMICLFASTYLLFLAFISGFNCVFEAIFQENTFNPILAEFWSLLGAVLASYQVIYNDAKPLQPTIPSKVGIAKQSNLEE